MGRGERLAVVRRRCKFLFGLLSGYLQHVRKGRAALFARELGELPHVFANERDNLLRSKRVGSSSTVFMPPRLLIVPKPPNSRGFSTENLQKSVSRADSSLRLRICALIASTTKLPGCFRHATA
jgi:hypothetical protein